MTTEEHRRALGRERQRRWRANHPEYKAKAAANQRAYRQRNLQAVRERDLQWYYDNRERLLMGRRVRLYGLSTEQFDELWQAQNGCCGICQAVLNESFNVDHCHTTDRVRGLLCGTCNRGIGLLRDDPKILRAALEWLDD